jgi:hypothetical protein
MSQLCPEEIDRREELNAVATAHPFAYPDAAGNRIAGVRDQTQKGSFD